LKELSITHHEDGSNRSAKYHRDIALLLEALKQDPENPRNVYYLAQSYRDVGDYANAALYYERRLPMRGWIEETWHALYQLGRMQALLGSDLRVVQHTYLQAYNLRPTRLEPAYALARFYRENGQYALGFHFARLVNEILYPDDLLFIERDVYDYLLRIEYGLCCEALGRTKEAIGAFETVLESVRLPQELRSLVEQKLSNHTGCHFRSIG
jgi:tetratricopeptide (TPR) repeat protein